jgi:hypothetical protein
MNTASHSLLRRCSAAVCTTALGLLLVAAPLQAQQASLQEVISDTQRMEQSADRLTLVWWIPAQFWEISLAQNADVSPKQVRELVASFEPYTVVAIVDGAVGPMAGITYPDEAVVRESVRVVDVAGKRYRAMKTSEIAPDVQNMISMMQPMIANMLGPMGTNMHFLVFQNSDDQTAPLDPLARGTARVEVADRSYKYRLPLGSLMPPRFDPDSGERFPGNFVFSPFTGKKLREAAK